MTYLGTPIFSGSFVWDATKISGSVVGNSYVETITGGAFTITNNVVGSRKIVGQSFIDVVALSASSVVLRTILSTTGAPTVSAAVSLYNLTAGAYVDIAGPGRTTLGVTASNPTAVQSVNLMNAANFTVASSSLYEVRVFIQHASYEAVHGSSVFFIK